MTEQKSELCSSNNLTKIEKVDRTAAGVFVKAHLRSMTDSQGISGVLRTRTMTLGEVYRFPSRPHCVTIKTKHQKYTIFRNTVISKRNFHSISILVFVG